MTPPPDAATQVRDLLRRSAVAALAVRLPATAEPYAALVLVASDHRGQALLLISGLAEHTKALRAEPTGCLLLDGTAGGQTRLAGPRASLIGRFAPVDDPLLKARFVRRHPEAALYQDFADFALWRQTPTRAHLVAGFGRISWADGAACLAADRTGGALAEQEGAILDHMNADHGDVVALYATALLGQPAGAWRLSGIDPEGLDLAAGGQRARLPLDPPIDDVATVRARLVALAQEARAAAL